MQGTQNLFFLTLPSTCPAPWRAHSLLSAPLGSRLRSFWFSLLRSQRCLRPLSIAEEDESLKLGTALIEPELQTSKLRLPQAKKLYTVASIFQTHSTPPLHTVHSTLDTSHSNSTLYTLHSELDTPHSALYTLRFTLKTWHSTLYTLQLKLHILHLTLRTLHFTLHTLHFTLHALHFTLHTPHSIFYTWLSTLYTLHTALRTLHFRLHTPHSTLYTLDLTLHTPRSHFTLHTLYSTLYTWHFTLYTLHSTLHCTLYTSRSTLYTPHSTLHTLHFTLHTPPNTVVHHFIRPFPHFAQADSIEEQLHFKTSHLQNAFFPIGLWYGRNRIKNSKPSKNFPPANASKAILICEKTLDECWCLSNCHGDKWVPQMFPSKMGSFPIAILPEGTPHVLVRWLSWAQVHSWRSRKTGEWMEQDMRLFIFFKIVGFIAAFCHDKNAKIFQAALVHARKLMDKRKTYQPQQQQQQQLLLLLLLLLILKQLQHGEKKRYK